MALQRPNCGSESREGTTKHPILHGPAPETRRRRRAPHRNITAATVYRQVQSGAKTKRCQASSFEATGTLWTRPRHTCTRPDLAGATVITVDEDPMVTADDTEGKNYAAFCYTPTGLRDGDALT